MIRPQKRGSGRIRSLDVDEGERRYRLEPADEMTPERIYERRWAMTLLNKAVESLRDDYLQSSKLHVFEALKAYLGGQESTVPYRDLAEQLGTSEGAVKVAVHRLRQRCRDMPAADHRQYGGHGGRDRRGTAVSVSGRAGVSTLRPTIEGVFEIPGLSPRQHPQRDRWPPLERAERDVSIFWPFVGKCL